MTDKLTDCPCGKSDACYERKTSGIKTYMCYGCGFLSNDLMRKGLKFFKEQLEVLPELYKEIMWKDEKGKQWMPSTINIPTVGMVFFNGKTVEEGRWTAVKSVPISEEEKSKFPNPHKPGEYYEHKMDPTTSKDFDRYDFIGALEHIGYLPKDEEETKTEE